MASPEDNLHVGVEPLDHGSARGKGGMIGIPSLRVRLGIDRSRQES